MAIDINPYLRCKSKFKKSCIAVKILKGFTFSTRPRLCLMVKHKVPYNIFQKWYKDTRKKIVEVKVDGIPVEGGGETETEPNGQFHNVSPTKDKSVRIWVDIRISNGLHLSQKNLSYQDLVRMIEKLEGLC